MHKLKSGGRTPLTFTDEVIQQIFGHEAAENEEFHRLKEYYFKSQIYDKITADLPMRILVGHKGIGKSALFTVSIHEEQDLGRLSVLIRPDDILGIGVDTKDFLKLIREWKQGLQAIIAGKAIESFGLSRQGRLGQPLSVTGKLLSFVRDTVSPYAETKVSLAPAEQLLLKNFLHHNAITVFVDDVDRGWQGMPEDALRISALINAMRDLSRDNDGLRFKLSLRSDVYFLVRTSDESTDKIEGSVVWFSWTNHEILALLAKRVETFFGRAADEQSLLSVGQSRLAEYLTPVMEPRFNGYGKWANVPVHQVLMSLVRKRPRDLVKLCSLAARHAYDMRRHKITTDDLNAVFQEYSQGRMQDTFNEFRSELPEIERLLVNMKPNRLEKQASLSYSFTTDGLLKKINNIIQQGRFRFKNGKEATARDLAAFLYKINFLTARKVLASGEIDRQYFEENRYLSAQFADFGYDWEVHPAYRWALQPDTIEDIFKNTELSIINP